MQASTQHSMQVQTYLYFDGRCEEALAFYRQALGAETIALMRFSESPEPAEQCGEGMALPPGSEDKIMHCSFRIGATEIMASDGFCGGQAVFQGFALALILPDKAAVNQAFDRLADGGETTMPPEETFFSPAFGMVKDRFGVQWSLVAATDPN